MMLQSTQSTVLPLTSSRRAVQPVRAVTPQSSRDVPRVTLEVTVSGTSSANGRRALHAALGNNLQLYVVTIDKRNERMTFRVEVISRTLDEVIGALTSALDRATLGRATCSMLRRSHNL
ncbi:hypothetical protein [Paraburkholderia sp. DHOC27]|uniref:hypothetical protein n=1 Tax=Paraburkholderia sp. DHOC27 TaxID=2303330 RepID=UPI000E3DC238|nr:hypothetical protein [Paraburkholderia sp. DHOC27]RFU49417.1 hypothetical protein D0B32_06395 [Paraburkholderia sp. DHOC27]